MARVFVEYLFCMIESMTLILLCDMFLHQRRRGGLQFLPGILLIAGLLHLMQWLGFSFHVGRLLVSITVDLLFIHIHFRGELLKKLFLLFGFLLSSAAAQGLAAVYTERACSTEATNVAAFDNPHGTVVATLYLIVIFLLLVVFERFRTVKAAPLSNRTWLCLLSIPVFSLFAVWFLFPFGKRSRVAADMQMVEGMSFFLLLINFLSFALYRNTAANVMLNRQVLDTQAALERERTHYANLLTAQEIVSDKLHDYLRDLNFLSVLLATGQVREAASHLNTLIGGIRIARAVKHTGNPQIDALLTQKLAEFALLGMEVDIHGRLPHELGFDTLDVSAIIGNALDNAAEACVRQRIKGKCIRLSFLMECSSLLIEVSNPSKPPISQKTWKMDARMHGRGLEIMRRVAEKYEGSLICQHQNGRFTVSVLLQEPPKS